MADVSNTSTRICGACGQAGKINRATVQLVYAGPVGGLDRSTERQVKQIANAAAGGLAQQLDSMKVEVNGAG